MAVRVETSDLGYRIVPEGTEVGRPGYYHPTVYVDRARAERKAEQVNALLGQAFSVRVRGGTQYLARTLARHDAPGGDGWVQVVEYHWMESDPPRVYIAVEVPSRRAVMFRLEQVARFNAEEIDAALAFARAEAAAGRYAAGEPYTPAEIHEIERGEGNPAADENFVHRMQER